MREVLAVLADNAAIVAVLAVVASLLSVAVTIARNYHNVPPNQVAVVSGRQRRIKTTAAVDESQTRRGYRVVRGGGFLLWPVLERLDMMSLNAMSFEVVAHNVPDINGVLVSVTGIANVKILSNDEELPLAIERFLGFTTPQIQSVAKENLESNLRAIVGTLSVEQMNKDRNEFQSSVMSEAVADLKKLGLGVDILNIQSVSDEQGYMTSLGKKRTAEVKRDAEIGEAEAKRDAAERVAAATQVAEVKRAQSEAAISDAQRDKEQTVAQNAATVAAAKAKIPIAAAIATQVETKALNLVTVEAKQAQVRAETELQGDERKRRDAELQATVIVTAERERDAALINADSTKQARLIVADADQKAAELEGEALRIKESKEGQGQQAKAEAVAQGRIATARAIQAEQEAAAAGTKATMLATAAGQEAQALAVAKGREAELLAEANGTKARLLAEAEGAREKAKAFKELDDAGRFLLILEASPKAIDAIGAALAQVLTPVAGAIGDGLGNIKEVRLVDMGGANQAGGNLLTQFAGAPIDVLRKLYEQAIALGFGPAVEDLMKKAGINTEGLRAEQ